MHDVTKFGEEGVVYMYYAQRILIILKILVI
eukprot:UN09835